MMTVAIGDSTILVEDPTLPQQVFFPPDLSLASIPNPSGSLESLAGVDVRRLAIDGLVSVAATLFNETLEAGRGAHTHELECGTIEVEIGEISPILTADLRECAFSRIGLVWDGRLTIQWTGGGQPSPDRLVLPMALEGDFEVGGGVPRTRFERIVWTADLTRLEEGSGIMHLTGELVGDGSSRPFDFEVEFDD